MPTPTEKRILQERRAKRSGDLLVPILEEMLENEVIPETPEDFRFMDMLVRARAIPREKGVFSPSMLGSCIRQAYFSKRGVEKHVSANPTMNGYFLKGNFVHLQWQFAMWRAHTLGLIELVSVPITRELVILDGLCQFGHLEDKEHAKWSDALNFNGDCTRPAVEVRVFGKEADFGGTIDVLFRFPGQRLVHVLDFKGINLIEFQRQVKKGAKRQYRVQIVGYGDIVNESQLIDEEVADAILVSECKAGPISGSGSPIALHETFVNLSEHIGEVRSRLKTLRWYDGRNELPPPACKNTTLMQFQECPFNRFCRDEVKAVQRELMAKAAKLPKKKLTVAKPTR